MVETNHALPLVYVVVAARGGSSTDPHKRDGLTNLQEYQMGTNPRDAHSGLQFTSIARAGANVLLTFNAVSNFTYSVEYSDLLVGNSWHTFQTISAVQTNRVLQFTVPANAATQRFYRLLTPAVAPH